MEGSKVVAIYTGIPCYWETRESDHFVKVCLGRVQMRSGQQAAVLVKRAKGRLDGERQRYIEEHLICLFALSTNKI